jgi:hypothetical protein
LINTFQGKRGAIPVVVLTSKYTYIYNQCLSPLNHFGGVMVSMLTLSAVDHAFKPRTGQTKDYEIGICCFSAKHAALRRKIKDWLARNQSNVSD